MCQICDRNGNVDTPISHHPKCSSNGVQLPCTCYFCNVKRSGGCCAAPLYEDLATDICNELGDIARCDDPKLLEAFEARNFDMDKEFLDEMRLQLESFYHNHHGLPAAHAVCLCPYLESHGLLAE